jgi:hypothetical protein
MHRDGRLGANCDLEVLLAVATRSNQKVPFWLPALPIHSPQEVDANQNRGFDTTDSCMHRDGLLGLNCNVEGLTMVKWHDADLHLFHHHCRRMMIAIYLDTLLPFLSPLISFEHAPTG